MGVVNYAVPLAKLREETMKLARTLMNKNPMAIRYTKEAMRVVRTMSEVDARDYLRAKGDALIYRDKENGRMKGMTQFLDEKSFRPGLGNYRRDDGKK